MRPATEPPSGGSAAATGLLLAGMLGGLGLALWSIQESGAGALAEGVIAQVGDIAISQARYDQALAALVEDKRAAPTPADRERLLTRLVDEELLVQYALALGLSRSVQSVRATLVGSVLDLVRAEADARPLDAATLRSFFALERAYFTLPEQWHVRGWSCADADCAEALVAALGQGGQPLPTGATLLPIPDGAMPANRLEGILGAQGLAQLQELNSGTVTAPYAVGDHWQVLQLLDRHAAPAPEYEAVAAQVEAEFRRRESEAGLQALLQRLRDAQQIQRRAAP